MKIIRRPKDQKRYLLLAGGKPNVGTAPISPDNRECVHLNLPDPEGVYRYSVQIPFEEWELIAAHVEKLRTQ